MLSLKKEAQSLMKAGVQIYPVGVWADELNMRTLLDIAPSPNNFFNTEFFGDLLAQLKQISKAPCSSKFLVKGGSSI